MIGNIRIFLKKAIARYFFSCYVIFVEADSAKQAAEQQVEPTAFQRLGELAMGHDLDPADFMPEWMAESYSLLLQHGHAREIVGRQLGMGTLAEVLEMEAAVAERVIRALPPSVRNLETVQALRRALAAEGKQWAATQPSLPEKTFPPAGLSVTKPLSVSSESGSTPPTSKPKRIISPATAAREPAAPTKVKRPKRPASGMKSPQPKSTNRGGRPPSVRPALQDIDRLFERRGVDPADFLYTKYLQAYIGFVKTDEDGDKIVQGAGYAPGRASAVQGRILEQLRDKAAHILGFPVPKGPAATEIAEPKPESYAGQPDAETPWATRERFVVIRGLGTLVTEREVDITQILTPRLCRIFNIYTDSALDDEKVRQEIRKISTAPLFDSNWRILNRIIQRVPPDILQLPERRRAAIEILKKRRPISRKRIASPGTTVRKTLLQIDHILRDRADAGECDYPETLLESASPLQRKAYPLLLQADMSIVEIARKLSAPKTNVRSAVDSLIVYFPKAAPHILGFKPPLMTLEELGESPPSDQELRNAAMTPCQRGEQRELLKCLYLRLEKLEVNPADVLRPHQVTLFQLLVTTDMTTQALASELGVTRRVMRNYTNALINRLVDTLSARLLNMPALRRAARAALAERRAAK